MSQDLSPRPSKKRYILPAVAAVFFLFVLPSIVLAMASNMTGIDIISIGEEKPLAPHQIVGRKRVAGGVAVWVRTDEDTSAAEMKRIVRNIVKTNYRGRPRMTVYFFRKLDPESNLPKNVGTHSPDDTYVWTSSDGIRKIL